jgi:TPR repeat protein
MSLDRPIAALLAAVLVLQAALFFHLYDMQGAIPKIRTLMPAAPMQTIPLPSLGEVRQARALCFSTEPVWQGEKSQMEYCMMAAASGDPQAQNMVAQFYMNGSTSASQAEAYAWLRAAAQNRRDRAAASAARLRLSDLVHKLDPATVEQAEQIAAQHMRGYAR